MLRQGLILTSQREYAQMMRIGLLGLGDVDTRVDIELDAFRAMQLVPQQYALILIDAMMASMDGLQLLQLMKQQAPTSKFVIVSDAPDETSRAQAYQCGADLFLGRPQNPPALKKVLNDIRGLIKPTTSTQSLQQSDDEPVVRLIDVVQTCCLSGDSVLLLVRSKQFSGDIFIYRGEVYHAQYPGKSGEGALLDMAQWDDGLVRAKTLKLGHVPPRTIETPYSKLLDRAKNQGGLALDMRPPAGQFLTVSGEASSSNGAVADAVLEAPPLESAPAPVAFELPPDSSMIGAGGTVLPNVNSHWKINLMGELVEGSQMADPDRCAFITYFIYRKLADVAVALEVDYFTHLTLIGPHLHQVLMADNMGVRHAVFDGSWANEADREQYVKWCCEQSF
jgi:CheY-like chemotaxis protein